MPAKPKPPAKATVDVVAPARTPSDSSHWRSDTPRHAAPDPFAVKTPGRIEPGGSTPHTEIAGSPPRVNVQPTASTSTVFSSVEPNLLQQYLIPAAIALPDADAQGLRTHKGRQYADVQGGGRVLIGVDPESGLHRAKRSSELQASGPVLAHDPVSQLWYPLEDFAADATAVRKGAQAQRHSGDDYDWALEELPGTFDGSPERFYLASESMPIKPFSAQELNDMRLAQPYSFRGNQLGTYNRVNNGKYPMRDTAGRPIRIRTLESRVTLETGDKYTSEQIKPYIKFEGYEDVARLYEEKLQLRLFTEADVKVAGEKSLIGQYMVVANRRIGKGETVGVYGGVLTPLRFISRSEQTFTMSAGAHMRYGGGNFTPDPIVIIGDNILSRINTHFEYDANGKPIRQAPEGYNVVMVSFKVEADMPLGGKTARRPYALNTLFASRDIPAGTELRWSYNYSDEEISWIFP
ncbi:hypothetical protein [Pseudomonas sp.]|uniref:hypothetical protein n=1 Tax=Pseudomonas sp. TaxID=306 RepID=UPI003BB4C969